MKPKPYTLDDNTFQAAWARWLGGAMVDNVRWVDGVQYVDSAQVLPEAQPEGTGSGAKAFWGFLGFEVFWL